MARKSKSKDRERFTIESASGRTFHVFQPDVNGIPLYAGAISCRRDTDEDPTTDALRQEVLTGHVFHLLQPPVEFSLKWPAQKCLDAAEALKIWKRHL